MPSTRTIIHLGKTHFSWKWLGRAAGNGSSEFMSTISSSIVGMLYNYQLLKYAGSNGVAAYGVIMYGGFIFTGVYFGFSMGIAPVISYHYGAADTDGLKGLFKKSLRIIMSFMIILVVLSEIFAKAICSIFVGYDTSLLSLTTDAFRIYSVSYVFMGFNIFGSSLFTALNNGVISALISFMRTLVFEVVSVLLLPIILGINGVWSAVICAEAFCLIVTVTCILKFRSRYHYA